jgi:uncharacterized protein
MSESVLEEMIRQALSGREQHVAFVWQGGEPTLMGLPFFNRVVEYQRQYGNGRIVSNALQTNGVLLDDAWAEFLREFRFLVGLSIDGPEQVHDHYRRFKGGQGSWSRVVNSARMLREHGVEVNAISVVTENAAHCADEIYQFHKAIGLNNMQFVPCVETDPLDPTRAAPYSVSAEQYGKFLVRLFDLWQADFDGPIATTSIRFFDSVFHTYVGLDVPECTLMQTCGVYVVVEHNGDVFACDFYVDPEWKLGNVMTDNLFAMLNTPLQQTFGQKKADLPGQCLQCEWLRSCRGGCTKDRMRDPRDKGICHFCESYKMFFEYADRRLRNLALEWTSRMRH